MVYNIVLNYRYTLYNLIVPFVPGKNCWKCLEEKNEKPQSQGRGQVPYLEIARDLRLGQVQDKGQGAENELRQEVSESRAREVVRGQAPEIERDQIQQAEGQSPEEVLVDGEDVYLNQDQSQKGVRGQGQGQERGINHDQGRAYI